jgi:hypothetical protein
MEESLSHFTPVKNGKAGELLYKWDTEEGLSFFIALIISPKSLKNCFMVEIACSTSGSLPRKLIFQSPDPRRKNVRYRLPIFWANEWSNATEPWWWIGERPSLEQLMEEGGLLEHKCDIRRETAKQVDDAVAKIKKFALPFFEDVRSIQV